MQPCPPGLSSDVGVISSRLVFIYPARRFPSNRGRLSVNRGRPCRPARGHSPSQGVLFGGRGCLNLLPEAVVGDDRGRSPGGVRLRTLASPRGLLHQPFGGTLRLHRG